jgi:hypothetical protein
MTSKLSVPHNNIYHLREIKEKKGNNVKFNHGNASSIFSAPEMILDSKESNPTSIDNIKKHKSPTLVYLTYSYT